MDNIRFSKLNTQRLTLRKFQEFDVEAFFAYRPDPKVAAYQGEGWLNYTLDKAKAFVRKQIDFEPGIPGTWFQIAIELKESGELIGDLGVYTLPQDAKQVEIGFTLNPSYQNKGYGLEAVKCLIGYLFRSLDMHRVIAVVDVRNKPSIGLIEKIGMRKEGHFIKNCWDKGEYTDEYSFALLNEEWQN